MSFHILGGLEVWAEGELLRLGGTLRERTLVMLLLEADRVVPVTRLVQAAWDGEPPGSASHQIRKAVAELRQRIPGGAGLITTDGPGYRLRLAEDRLDLGRYRALVRQARAARAEGRPGEAAAALQEALELWRGPVMAGAGGPVIEAAAAALEEERLASAEQLFELRLAAGEAAAVIGDLRALVHQHPLRETLRGQLMLALYRTGRQAEALEEYGQVRTLLAEELGIDPSARLCDLYERILRQSPDLLAAPPARPPAAAPPPAAASAHPASAAAQDIVPGTGTPPPGGPGTPGPGTPNPAGIPGPGISGAVTAPAAPAAQPRPGPGGPGRRAAPEGQPVPAADADPAAGSTVPHTLPYDLRDFSGRAAELRWISEAVDRFGPACARIVAIDGMGGSGKTTLAVRAAYALADRFPDGQLFVDLRGFTPGQEPLTPYAAHEALLAAAGVPVEEIPTSPAGRTSLWQSFTQRRRLLVVLDNAADAEQVRALVPCSAQCLTLVTSRPRLLDLDGAEWLSLGVLPLEDSTELLRRTLGAERVTREPRAAEELIRLCGGLPLAVRIAAARLRNRSHWTVGHLVDRLADERRRLDELNSAGRSVAVALRLSYRSMTEQQRSCFRLLSLHPGRAIGPEEAAALLGTDPRQAEDLLEALLDAHLLEAHEPGWYGFHDLVRSFAHGLRDEETEERDAAAVERLLDHYVVTAERAGALLVPQRRSYADMLPDGRSVHPDFAGQEEALRWLDRHRHSLLAAVDMAYERGLLRHAACLSREIGLHSDVRNYPQEASRALSTGAAAARQLGEGSLQCLVLSNLAMQHWKMGNLRDGIAHAEEALEAARSAGDRIGQALALGRLGQFYNGLGELDRALSFTGQSAALEEELGLTRERAGSSNIFSSIHARCGRYAQAAREAQEALTVFRATGEIAGFLVSVSQVAAAQAGLGHLDTAWEWLSKGLQRCEHLGPTANTALLLAQSAEVLVRLRRPEEARRYAQRALDEIRGQQAPAREAQVENHVGRVHHALGSPAEALACHRRAYESASSLGLRYEAAQALQGLAQAARALADDDAADDHQRRADALFDAMGVPVDARRPF
ncbi:AfsR/SARP family transcriptional regulator [Streptomyces mexicanus]|uniref:AfsR/SARP family transcriptional regulator n=1 Tax=Streptomyces mexicanus TaxID=178566 RepID=UPI0036CED8EC